MTAYLPPMGSKDWGAFWRSLLSLASGRSNATGTVTLTVSATTTTINDGNVAPGSAILLDPVTANAAAARASTYTSVTGQGSFTLTHASNTQADRTFTYAILG
jgi:hypothetical protein